jgi:hypothetical protein
MSSPLSGTAAGVSALADAGTVATLGDRGAGYAFGVVFLSVSCGYRDGRGAEQDRLEWVRVVTLGTCDSPTVCRGVQDGMAELDRADGGAFVARLG